LLIKEKKSSDWFLLISSAIKHKFKTKIFLKIFISFSAISTFVIVLLYFLYLGASLQKQNKFAGYRPLLKHVLRTNFKIPINYIHGLRSNPKKLIIDIKHMDMQKLSYFREYALNEKLDLEYFFFEDSKATITRRDKLGDVPATITYNGKSHRAKISLTGWTLQHYLSPNKHSLKVKLKGDDAVMGMNKFSLLNIAGRDGGVNEWFCHKLSAYEGLISLKTDLVQVSINGMDRGLFFVEEGFNKILIERNKHREGIVFKPTIPMDVLGKKKILKSPVLRKNMGLLDVLYRDFLSGKLSTSQLFDIKQMAKYYAITDLVNGFHQLAIDNIHLYFNPVTRLVEPIGREWGVDFYAPLTSICGELKNGWIRPEVNYFHHKIFSDAKFVSEYFKALERLSKITWLRIDSSFVFKTITP